MALVVRNLLLVFFLLAVKLSAQMPVYGADSLKKHYQQKMDRFIDRDTALGDFYTIDLNGVAVFANAEDKKANKPEYRVTWQELRIYKAIMQSFPREQAMLIMKEKGSGPFPPDIQRTYGKGPVPETNPAPVVGHPLYGYRFAIDPGHFGFDSLTTKLEDKFIDMYVPSGSDSVRVNFYESKLTWQTADLLASMLTAAGASVKMTRKAYGLTAFGKTFEQWKIDDYPRTLDSLLQLNPADPNLKKLKSGRLKDNKSIFKFVFRDAELRKRAELINAFRPDLTIIIHYNVDELNKPWSQPTTKNFCMAFVGGAFQRGELGDSERRFDLLRLLLLDDLEKSIYASGLAAESFKSVLEVPLAKRADATYLKDNCLSAGVPGVFCRNLSLTRLVQGPLIYGETLYQDNKEECIRFNREANASGYPKPGDGSRVSEVAEAYYYAILTWAQTK